MKNIILVISLALAVIVSIICFAMHNPDSQENNTRRVNNNSGSENPGDEKKEFNGEEDNNAVSVNTSGISQTEIRQMLDNRQFKDIAMMLSKDQDDIIASMALEVLAKQGKSGDNQCLNALLKSGNEYMLFLAIRYANIYGSKTVKYKTIQAIAKIGELFKCKMAIAKELSSMLSSEYDDIYLQKEIYSILARICTEENSQLLEIGLSHNNASVRVGVINAIAINYATIQGDNNDMISLFSNIALSDSNPEVKIAALSYMAEVKESYSLYFNTYLAALTDTDDEVRSQAAYFLSKISDKYIIPYIESQLMSETSESVKINLINSIANNNDEDAAINSLTSLMYSDLDLKGKCYTLSELHKYNDRKLVLDLLRHIIIDGNSEAKLKQEALRVFTAQYTEDDVSMLVDALRDSNPETRREVIFALMRHEGKWDSEYIKAIRDAIDVEDSEVNRSHLENLLNNILSNN